MADNAVHVKSNVVASAVIGAATKAALHVIGNAFLPAKPFIKATLAALQLKNDFIYEGVFGGGTFYLIQTKDYYLDYNETMYHTPETNSVINYLGNIVGGVFGSSLTNYATLSNVLGKSGSVLNNQGDIIGGEYHSLMIHNIGNGNINGGIWHTNVYNQAAINGGDFKASVLNQANGVISGGHFAHLINSSGGKITNLSSNNVDLLDNIGGSVDNCSLSNIVNKNGIILNTKANKIDAFSHEKHGITKNIEAGDLVSIQAKEVNAHDGVAIKYNGSANEIECLNILDGKVEVFAEILKNGNERGDIYIAKNAILEDHGIEKVGKSDQAVSVTQLSGEGFYKYKSHLFDTKGNNITNVKAGASDDYNDFSGVSLESADGENGSDTLKLDSNSQIGLVSGYEKIKLKDVVLADTDGYLLPGEVGLLNPLTMMNLTKFASFGDSYLLGSDGVNSQLYAVGNSIPEMLPQITLIATLDGNYALNLNGELDLVY